MSFQGLALKIQERVAVAALCDYTAADQCRDTFSPAGKCSPVSSMEYAIMAEGCWVIFFV